MSHQTIVDPTLIYPADPMPKKEIVAIKGGFLEVRGEGENRQIDRLISTDPQMYLDTRYAPYSKYDPHMKAES